MTFARKIFIFIFLSTALVIVGMSVITHFWISNHQKHESIRHAKNLAMLVALKSEDYILRNDLVALHQFYQSIIKVDPYVGYIFAEREGEILVHTFEKGVPRGLLRLDPLIDASKADISPVTDSHGDLIYHLRIGIGDPPHSMLHFGIFDKNIRAALNPHRNMMLVVGSILLAVVPFSLALFLSRMVSKPIRVLRTGVEQIGSGKLDCRLEIPTGDEIEHLVNDINTMAEKLEKSQAGLKSEIAERVQAEAALAEQTELLNTILDNVPHNIYWKDKQAVYLGCNKAFAETAGLEYPQLVVGKTDYDLPWKRDEADFYRLCDQKVLDTGTPMVDLEGTLTRADGQVKNVITSEVPLKDHNGSVFGVVGIFYDVTERKRMEETIKQSQKMEAIGTLAGGIAHDFNNILASIIGYSELLEDDLDRNDPAYDYLRQVLIAATRAKDLVRQILTFSRKSQETRRPVELAEIVTEEAKLLRSTLPATIEIRPHIEAGGGMVDADPTQMHQVVMNLCTNAAHAMREGGGLLEIHLSPIDITEQDTPQRYRHVSTGPFMQLKISDTGTGIDSRILHRIYDPFFTTKDKEQGTGMGLSVVHGIVKDHGGEIIVESYPEVGTTFTVLLPRVVSTADSEEALVSAVPRGSERILFVDDEKSLLKLGEKMMASLGYSVATVDGSLEALRAYERSPDAFDLVITDHTMPHMTGFELAKRLLAINPSARIVLCTGYSDRMTPEKAKAAGITSFLYKPLSRSEIAAAIREALDR